MDKKYKNNILRNSYDEMNPKQQALARQVVIDKHKLKWRDFTERQSKYDINKIEARKLLAYIDALSPILTARQNELREVSLAAYLVLKALQNEQKPKFGFVKKTKPALESVQ